MDTPILIIKDDFLPQWEVDPLHLKLTTEAKFTDEVSPGDGATYPNICKEFQPLESLKLHLEKLHGSSVDIQLSCFRLGLAGEPDDTFCHADGVYADRAAVLYLSKGYDNVGGTAFWRHVSGIDRVPSDEALKAAGYEVKRFHEWMTAQTRFENSKSWTMSAFAGLKYNRLISYPTAAFHSRYPNHIAEPFGSTPATGRLIWVAFYNLVPSVEVKS